MGEITAGGQNKPKANDGCDRCFGKKVILDPFAFALGNQIEIPCPKCSSKKEKGFTLVELMLAVAIVGILGSIVTATVKDVTRRSQEAVTKGNLSILRMTIGEYYASHDGQYPTDPTLASITTGNGYLDKVPTKFTPPYHPPGNDVDGGDWPAMVDSHAAWFYVSASTSPSWGTVVVNCVHQDLSGQPWSSY